MTIEENALAFAKLVLLLKWYRKEVSDVTEGTVREEAVRLFECTPGRVNKVIFVYGAYKALKELGLTEV